MKRFLFPGICIFMLLTCLVNCFAETKDEKKPNDLFVPSVFVEAINKEADFVVNAICSDEDAETRENIKSYIHLQYTEGEETMLWYDNEDWVIELSAYFEGSKADARGYAHSLTFSFPAGEENQFLYNAAGLAVSRVLCSREKSVDIYQFSKYIDSCYQDYLENGNGIMGPLKYDGFSVVIMFRYQYDMDRCAISIINNSN